MEEVIPDVGNAKGMRSDAEEIRRVVWGALGMKRDVELIRLGVYINIY